MVAVATCFEPTPVGVNVWSFIQRCLILLRNRARVGRGYWLVAGVIYPRFRVCSVPHHATDVRPWVPCLPPGGKGLLCCEVNIAHLLLSEVWLQKRKYRLRNQMLVLLMPQRSA